jgi:RNase H-like domain found in reverse transcriptase
MQVSQIMGLFSHFCEYIPNFAHHGQMLTNLTCKRSPERVPWDGKEQQAFDTLKELLCKATLQPLNIIDVLKSFCVLVDASERAAGGMLKQTIPDGTEQPVAFGSCKLNATQRNWSTTEKEEYAAIWCP